MQSTETVHEKAQTLDLLDTDFKLAILNIFKELKRTISKKTKGQNENIVSPNTEYQ